MKTLLVILIFALLISTILQAAGTVQDGGNIVRWAQPLSIMIPFATIICLSVMYEELRYTPTAMDVYKGNTEMKYTIVMRGNDTVSIDSLIVYKTHK